jgi:Tfp pilus assembly PilM family ATPase
MSHRSRIVTYGRHSDSFDIKNLLTAPAFPRTAISIDEERVALVSLKRRQGEFEPIHLTSLDLPNGLVTPSFNEPNIVDEGALLESLDRLVVDAGVKRLRRLAVAIPDSSARSHLISLEGATPAAGELAQVFSWKVERAFGCRTSEVRVTHRRLAARKDESHWLVTVVYNRVIAQYENVFKRLGWQVGLVLPGYLAEAQWLLRSKSTEDQVLLSLKERGFVAVVVRNGQPVLVRDVTCDQSECEDEFHRLMIFYRDRLMPKNAQLAPSRLLVIGPTEMHQRFRKTLAEAMEAPVTILDAGSLGLRLPSRAPFSRFAAAAGLSTFAWA